MSHFKTTYPDVIVNAFKSIQAWKTLAVLLIGMLLVETIALGWIAVHRTVVLIPQHLSDSKGPINLSLGEPFAPDYLTAIAKGDAYSLLNWTPEDIDQQYGAFMARLTPAMSDVQREVLLSEAKQHRDEGLSQSFYVTRSFVKGPAVELHGILVRATGGREIFRGPVVYEFRYANVGDGMLLVAGVTQPSNKPTAPNQAN